MQISRLTPGSLVVRNTPWTLWLFCALWTAIGVALLGVQLGWFSDLRLPEALRAFVDTPSQDLTVESRDPTRLAVAFVMIVSGLLVLSRAASTSWTFADGVLTVSQARLIGTRTESYPLHALRYAELQRSSRGATRVAIVRAAGSDLMLTSYYSGGNVTRKQQAVATINEALAPNVEV